MAQFQNSPIDELAAQLRAHIPAIKGLADRAFAVAQADNAAARGRLHQFERVAMRAADLIGALTSLAEG